MFKMHLSTKMLAGIMKDLWDKWTLILKELPSAVSFNVSFCSPYTKLHSSSSRIRTWCSDAAVKEVSSHPSMVSEEVLPA